MRYMKNPADTFEHAIIKQSGNFSKQDVQKSLEIALRNVGSALSGMYYRLHGQGSPYGAGGRYDATVDFTPDEAKRLKKAEIDIIKARDVIFDAYRSIEDIDLGFQDRHEWAHTNWRFPKD
jgi:hypothetical protein